MKENLCHLRMITSITEISNIWVTFAKSKICCPAHLYSRSYALEKMWEIEILWLRFFHFLHMSCLIKNWKHFHPLKLAHSLPFGAVSSKAFHIQVRLVWFSWTLCRCILVYTIAYELPSGSYFWIFINISVSFNLGLVKATQWIFLTSDLTLVRGTKVYFLS